MIYQFPSEPTVSVITPNYNGHRFIRRAVECVRRQNYPVEHIIVDDCSTDGSSALLEKLSNEFPWLRSARLPIKSGPAVARNKAIDLAQGRFLAFLDIDDFWLPHKIKTQIDFMLSNNSTLSFSDYRFVSEDGKKIGRRIQGCNRINWHLHHMTRYLGCLTIVLDRKQYPEFKFPNLAASVRAEDFIAWSRCIKQYGPALRCPHDLARYSVVNNSRSSKMIRASYSSWYVYREIEKICFLEALFYFFTYSLGVLWKRFWNRPFMNRAEIDQDYGWSLLQKFGKENGI